MRRTIALLAIAFTLPPVLSLAVPSAAAFAAASTAAPAPAYGVKLVRTMIPMPDGVQLAATLYVPDGAPKNARFPALLEYLPYRKDDDEAQRDYGTHEYFARRGFVGARVDIRGFGNSGGAPPKREYSQIEQQDGERVIAWLAAQPWSNGNVGMLGISWGGFNSIQIALRRPPALKAILACDATEELFKEDVHYIDGIMHVDEFELTMDLDQGRSGAPDFSLDESVIGPRMDSEPWSLNYLRQQRGGPFWREPVRPIETLAVPTFLIGGLQDGYRDSVPRMLERVKAPIKAWVGPWNHAFPNESDYGPLYEWRDEALRWFDHWLNGKDNGVLEDPKLVVFLQHSRPPGQLAELPGEWRAETWPPRGLEKRPLFLQPNHRLDRDHRAADQDRLRYIPSAGVEAGFWWGELLADQRPVDAFSLVYDTDVLDEDIAVLGRPHVLLNASADASQADWFARLEDVAPDGSVTLVTGAGLNGAQRDSADNPVALEPGKSYALSIDLHLASWVFPKGHRIRLAISNALWPMCWPTPFPMTTTLALGGASPSRIDLPVVPVRGTPPPALQPPKPVAARADIKGGSGAWPGTWTLLRDQAAARSTVVWSGTSHAEYPWGRSDHSEKLTYIVADDHPDVSTVIGDSEYVQKAGDRTLRWVGRLEVTSDATTFHYTYSRQLYRDQELVRSKSWNETIPRDHQ